jgi:Flp pilus assembly protein TadG
MMQRLAWGFWRNTGGASAVEFAMVALPLCLLLFGTVEFGRLYWAQHVLEETAIAAARCMAVPQTECSTGGAYDAATTRAHVVSQARELGIGLEPADVVVDRAASCAGVTGFSSVSLSYTFKTAVPALMTALAGEPTLSARACFPNQG